MSNQIIIFIVIIIFAILAYFIIKNMKCKNCTPSKENFGIVSECNTNVEHLIPTYNDCDWDIGRMIGKGEQGEVFLGNCYSDLNNPDKNYAIKVLENVVPEFIQKEAMNQYNLPPDISPAIYDSFICNNNGYIVMDKLDMSLFNYLNSIEDKTLQKQMFEYLKNQAIQKLQRAIDLGIVHDDTHKDNMMVKILSNGQPELFFIDWYYTQNKKLTNDQIVAKLIDFNLTFNSIDKELNKPSNIFSAPRAPAKSKRKNLEGSSTTFKSKLFDDDNNLNKKEEQSQYSTFDNDMGMSRLSNTFETPVKSKNKNIFQDEDDEDNFLIRSKPLMDEFELIDNEEDNYELISTPTKKRNY